MSFNYLTFTMKINDHCASNFTLKRNETRSRDKTHRTNHPNKKIHVQIVVICYYLKSKNNNNNKQKKKVICYYSNICDMHQTIKLAYKLLEV